MSEYLIISNIKKIAINSVIYSVGSIAQSAIGFFYLPILTQELSPDDFGRYSLILMATTIIASVFYLGMSTSMPRSYYDYTDNDKRTLVFNIGLYILLIGCFIQISIGYFYGGDIGDILFHSKNQHGPILWAFIASSLSVINQYYFTYVRMENRAFLFSFLGLFNIFIAIFAIYLLKRISGVELETPFQAMAISQITLMLVFLFLYRKYKFSLAFFNYEAKKIISFGFASVVASFGQQIIDWSDRIIMERNFGLSDVGEYSAALRVAGLINIIFILPFSQIWSPIVMRYKDSINLKKIFDIAFRSFIFIAFSISIVFIFNSKLILGYIIKIQLNDNIITYFTTGLFGLIFYGLVNITTAGFFYSRNLKPLIYIYYSVGLIKILLNLIFIKIFGIIAIPIISLVIYLALPFIIYFYSSKIFYFNISIMRFLIIFSISIITTLIINLEYIKQSSFAATILSIIVIYIFYRIATSEKERKHIKYYMNFIRLKK